MVDGDTFASQEFKDKAFATNTGGEWMDADESARRNSDEYRALGLECIADAADAIATITEKLAA